VALKPVTAVELAESPKKSSGRSFITLTHGHLPDTGTKKARKPGQHITRSRQIKALLSHDSLS
jgi:hypothetical protein